MTPERRDAVIEERLGYYRRRLQEVHATPFACLGVGHDEDAGELAVCTTEDLELCVLRDSLAEAVRLIDAQIADGGLQRLPLITQVRVRLDEARPSTAWRIVQELVELLKEGP